MALRAASPCRADANATASADFPPPKGPVQVKALWELPRYLPGHVLDDRLRGAVADVTFQGVLAPEIGVQTDRPSIVLGDADMPKEFFSPAHL